MDVRTRLCYYDSRNPNGAISEQFGEHNLDLKPQARDNCGCYSCTNCISPLAEEIMELNRRLKLNTEDSSNRGYEGEGRDMGYGYLTAHYFLEYRDADTGEKRIQVGCTNTDLSTERKRDDFMDSRISCATGFDYYSSKFRLLKIYESALKRNQAHGLEGSVRTEKRFSYELCTQDKDSIYVFGDNWARKGNAGQACIRECANAIGVPTKRLPSNDDLGFMFDSAIWFDKNIYSIEIALQTVKGLQKAGYDVVFPEDGLGTGLAKMPEKAPRTYYWMCLRIYELFGIWNGGEPLHDIYEG